MSALAGGRSQIVRISEQGELIVSVAVPVQRFRAVLGVLQLSTQGGDIDKIVKAERFAMMRVFAVAVIVNIILSIALLVAPGAIAFLVARTFAGMLAMAVGSVVFSALVGIFASYHINSEPAPTMVLTMTGLFVLALVASQIRDYRVRRLARG